MLTASFLNGLTAALISPDIPVWAEPSCTILWEILGQQQQKSHCEAAKLLHKEPWWLQNILIVLLQHVWRHCEIFIVRDTVFPYGLGNRLQNVPLGAVHGWGGRCSHVWAVMSAQGL
uniref:Uncharacterized protein n=1 Tax=Pavo cristatus TaxID=9049 RepID=A0A8C9EN12_PAVCR